METVEAAAERRHEDELKEDPRYRLAQRILATPDFVRSPQLSKFLHYICVATIQDASQTLSEHRIGVEVFGRSPDYDSAADTIVRSHALRLRRRLEQYFQRRGQDEPIHLIIPRGGYIPVFLPNPLHVPDGAETASAISPPATQVQSENLRPEQAALTSSVSPLSVQQARPFDLPDSTRSQQSMIWRYRILTTFLALLSLGLATAFGIHLRSHFKTDRHHILWERLFNDEQPTQIVLGDSGLVLFHAITRQHVSLHDYLNNDYGKQMPFVERVDPDFAGFLLHRRYTSVADATTLDHLLRLPEAIPERTLVRYSRDVHIEDFTSDNAIIIGSQEADPWVELFETHMDFVFSVDTPDRHTCFINRHPHVGELAEYNAQAQASRHIVYGVIAFLPNLDGTGNALILEGLSSAGTEAASDLAIDDGRLLPALNPIRRADGSLPHFEMLIESDTLRDSAGPARVVAIHTHD